MSPDDDFGNPSERQETPRPNYGLIAFVAIDFVVMAGIIWYFVFR